MKERYYITAHWRTRGILEVRACEPPQDGVLCFHYASAVNGRPWAYGSDWTASLADARADVERRRKETIAALKQQIATLEAYTPKIEEVK